MPAFAALRIPGAALSVAVACGLVAGLPTALAAKTSAETPTAFLARVYQPYRTGEMPPLDPARARAIFTAEIAQLIARDRAEAQGEVGRLEYDPICDCQDTAGLTGLRILPVVGPAAGVSRVGVRFANSGIRTVLAYTLRREGGHWRIADICSGRGRCLKAVLGKD